MAHKDLTETAGIRTTFGSPLFAGHVPERDELIVERLTGAGAIALGKTNVPEWGAGSNCVNPVFGATCNPYDLRMTPGGSSGGAAAALACGMVALADGSDMGGSLRNPASFCNVVGLRPTPGRVPVWPSMLGWDRLSVQGPMGRTVADVALMLSALAGPDSRSPISLDEPGSSFGVPLERDLRGVRVAWSRDLGGLPVAPEVTAALEPGREVLAALGCEVVDEDPDLTGAEQAFTCITACAGSWPSTSSSPRPWSRSRRSPCASTIRPRSPACRCAPTSTGRVSLRSTPSSCRASSTCRPSPRRRAPGTWHAGRRPA